ncbi:acyltransferase family protein [Streptomyces cinnamoneus]|uniref:Acyltransferase n=1 Tax=Streptomyces cinnamoneus TaxID=53446 RepID=A0A918TXD4_STRCJ|nr:acyltransferase [Streptomyces cinnamoneus]GHC63205.1 acyltransferase [Streptomyces cinnamoneus]
MASLTGVRFPAVLMVFLAHLSLIIPFADPKVLEDYHTYIGGIGKVGLSFFFMLSGFILAWAARENDSPVLFWRRRLVKIIPLHWLTFAIALAVFAGSTVTAKSGIMNLLMVQGWSSDPAVFGSVNAPSWSLTCLCFFYLLFPLLHRGVTRIRAQYLWWCAGAIAAAVVAVPAVVRAVIPADAQLPPGAPATSVDAFWIVDLLPATRLLDFVLGIVMARIVRSGRWIGVRPLPLAALVFVAYFASLDLPPEYRIAATTIVPLALFIASLAGSDLAGRKTVLAGRPIQVLGDVSYAFILIHWPVMNFFLKVFGEERLYSVPFAVAVGVLDLVVSIALAWVLTVTVEKPLVRLLAKPRKKAEPAVAASPASSPTRASSL